MIASWVNTLYDHIIELDGYSETRPLSLTVTMTSSLHVVIPQASREVNDLFEEDTLTTMLQHG